MSQESDGYTFPLPDGVQRTPVRYRNRFGIELAGDLYVADDLDRRRTHAAIVIGPPHGGVKEQGPGIHASQLALRGFVALAFDPSFNGDSAGDPRHLTSPEIFAEDFSAGVDLLGSLEYVDRDRIGALGMCGSGGFLLNQARVDLRIRAVATTAMYDISGAMRDGFEHSATSESRHGMLAQIAAQRWADADAGEPRRVNDFPTDEVDMSAVDPITAEFWEYYTTDRGRARNSVGGFTLTSFAAHIGMGALRELHDIAPRPILLVTGDQAHSRYFTEEVAAQLDGAASVLVAPGARHIDLYDRLDLIPVDAFEEFFRSGLVERAA